MARILWCAIWAGSALVVSGCDWANLNAASGEYVVVGPAPAHSGNPVAGKY